MSLATLPAELYFTILTHVPPSDLQTATLNLSRAIPFAPISLHPLFQHIVISRQQQVPQLYWRLHYSPRLIQTAGYEGFNKEPTWVKSFTLGTWQVDADVLVNLLGLLPQIERLSLNVGTVFSPEHLQDMFHRPAPFLNMLSLRFRPYVQKATYYQFLKGSYFDSTLELISSWPSSSTLARLSIIQDPLPTLPTEAHTKPFAQPIVFFSLAPLTVLSLAPATQRVTHVRLRVPSRQLIRFIASSRPPGSASYAFPSVGFLDLSTCAVRELSELEALLIHIGGGQLKHIVLDQTGLCNGNDGEWESLGRTCALAGVKRMREREKALKAWSEAESVADNAHQDDPNIRGPVVAQERRPRRGRRGLATATISLRDSPAQDASVLPTVLPDIETSKLSKAVKIRVLPPPPCLLSLNTSLPRPLGHQPTTDSIEAHEARARSDFAKGWSEGVGQLRATWARLRQSQSNGVRVVRFGANEPGNGQRILAGLVDMGKPGTDEYWEEVQYINPPVLCFAGPRGEEWKNLGEEKWPDHTIGCGHRIAWDIWGDNL